jgi:hypothetical protein
MYYGSEWIMSGPPARVLVLSNDDRPAITLIILSMLSIVWNRAEGSIGVHDDVELHFIHVCG